MSAPRIEEIKSRLKKVPPEPRALTVEEMARQNESEFVARLSRVKAIRESRRVNAFQLLNEDPRLAYEWVYNSPSEISRKEIDGWAITRSSQEGDVVTPYKQTDGAHVFGDLILMQLPKDDYDILVLLPQLEAWERTNGPAKYGDILAFAEQAGIPAEVREVVS